MKEDLKESKERKSLCGSEEIAKKKKKNERKWRASVETSRSIGELESFSLFS